MNNASLAAGRDLSHLKGGNPLAQKEALLRFLAQQGFVCDCGELVEDEGVLTLGWLLGRFPVVTERGMELVDDARVTAKNFHSRTCPAFLEALEHGVATGQSDGSRAPVAIVRDMPRTEWLKDPR
jgi:hypothetical protein